MPTSVLNDLSLNDIPAFDEQGEPIPYKERIKRAVMMTCKPISDDELAAAYNCVLCRDGEDGVDKEHFVKTGEIRRCECAIARDKKIRFERAVELTPRKFREQHGIRNGLNSLQSDPKIHPKQPAAIEKLKRNAEKSFYIFGRTGAHKTTMAWAMIQEAGRRGQPVGGNTGKSLIDTLRSYQFDKKKSADASFYALDQLENQRTRFCVLIDDIDGLVITEYTFGLLWDLLDKVQAYDQQLIITANKSIDRLLSEWATRDRDGRANAVNYCEKLARRLNEICGDIDLS